MSPTLPRNDVVNCGIQNAKLSADGRFVSLSIGKPATYFKNLFRLQLNIGGVLSDLRAWLGRFSSKVSPNLSALDTSHRGFSDVEFPCNFSVRSGAGNNLEHFGICQFRVSVSRSVGFIRTAFQGPVAIVIRSGAKEKMRRIHAIWNIATMKHAHPVWNWTDMQHPRGAMCPYSFTFVRNLAVSIINFAAVPFPAAAESPLHHVLIKSLSQWDRLKHVARHSLILDTRQSI